MKTQQIFLYGLLTVIVIFVVYQIMKSLGLIKDKGDRKTEKILDEGDAELAEEVVKIKKSYIDMNSSNLFDPLYWKSFLGKLRPDELLTEGEAKTAAKEIDSNISWYGDNEEGIYNVFRSIKNPINVSQIADEFQKLYGKDLATVLINNLTQGEVYIINQIIKGKNEK